MSFFLLMCRSFRHRVAPPVRQDTGDRLEPWSRTSSQGTAVARPMRRRPMSVGRGLVDLNSTVPALGKDVMKKTAR